MPEPNYYTDANGVVHPITSKKGKAAAVTLAGAALAGVMTAAGGGTAAESAGAALDSASARSAEPRARQSERKRRESWDRLVLRELKQEVKDRLRCGVQSYGKVREFFLRTPCKSLSQGLFALADTHGNTVVLSVMWVTMSSDGDAKELKTLEDTYGSGDVTPVGTQVLGFGGIKFTGRYYASRQNDELVVIAETEPVKGRPSATLLKNVATAASILPAPR